MSRGRLELSGKEAVMLISVYSGGRVVAGVYEWTPGKALKDCRIVDPQLCPDKENGSESEAPSR